MTKFINDSYLKLPVFQCKKCNLYVTGESEIEIEEKTKSIYLEKHWGQNNLWDATNAIKNNYTDIDSQGKRRHWISQYKYCKPYITNKKNILEIGAGQGQATFWFDNEGFSVTSIEPDENNVELINKKLKNSHCIVGTAENFQINEKFDVIWMSHVLEHIIKPVQFFENIRRNLKNEGIFFIEVPNCENDSMLNSSIFLVPHTFHFSKNSLANLAKKSGFKVVKSDYFRPATKLEGIVNKLTRSRLKKFQYYPRIPTNNKKGKFLRLLLKM
ncbi:class I SAM-dependent methyltransferase [Nitrosopumilus ureiphilus]|nr:class I SAM-dependent methyltransferase [Nitrosopumilus ureiphilus]